MPRITGIMPVSKRAKRSNIFIDNKFFCRLNFSTIEEGELAYLQEIDIEKIISLQYDKEKNEALDLSMQYLKARKTEKQVIDYLKEKGYLDKVISFVMEKLKGYNFIDDMEYATAYVEQFSSKKGKRLLKRELYLKGVSEEIISEALLDYDEDEDGLYLLLVKYYKGKALDYKTIAKGYNYALNKGFDGSLISNVIDRIKNENN